jgi:serine/threonine-protein kinase
MNIRQQIGPYRLVRFIGAGGMSAVYQGVDSCSLPVAIKLLAVNGTIVTRLQQTTDDITHYLDRFFKEIAINVMLSPCTDGIPRYIDHGVAMNGEHYLVVELIVGKTLKEHAEGRSISIREALVIVRRILQTLCCAHNLGIIHRDLKPANIMITLDGKVKVLDFGIARAFHSQTNPRFMVGNLQHMSPEQFHGQPVTARSDVYAVGSILHGLLVGRDFFSGSTSDAVRASRRTTRISLNAPPESRLSPSLWNLLYRSLQRDPEKRVDTAVFLHLIEDQLDALAATKKALATSSVIQLNPHTPANDATEAERTLVTLLK